MKGTAPTSGTPLKSSLAVKTWWYATSSLEVMSSQISIHGIDTMGRTILRVAHTALFSLLHYPLQMRPTFESRRIVRSHFALEAGTISGQQKRTGKSYASEPEHQLQVSKWTIFTSSRCKRGHSGDRFSLYLHRLLGFCLRERWLLNKSETSAYTHTSLPMD